MGDVRFERLTEGQKACLRLVYEHREIKEIARELKIAPDTVKQRLQGARRILEATRSIDAARLLAVHEAGALYPPQVYPPSDIPNPTDLASSAGTDQLAERQDDAADIYRVREALAFYEPPVIDRKRGFHWPFPTQGRSGNDLTLLAILFWIGAGAIVICIIALGLLAVAFASQDMFSRLL